MAHSLYITGNKEKNTDTHLEYDMTFINGY